MIDPDFWLARIQADHPPSPELTDWLSGRIAPVRVGWFERAFTDGIYRQFWSGIAWLSEPDQQQPHWHQVGEYPCWRGLSAEAVDTFEVFARFFNCMPIEVLKNDVPAQLQHLVGSVMQKHGYRMVFNRWYLQEPPTADPPTSDDTLRSMWRTAGGDFHGPNVETGTMPEARLLQFLRTHWRRS